MKNVLENIKRKRKQKGYSHENMAHELDISQVAYSKIEKSDTKLSVERLYKLAEILETSVLDLLNEHTENEFNQTNSDSAIGYQQQILNLYQDDKTKTEKIIQLYEARLKDKDRLIVQLEKMVK